MRKVQQFPLYMNVGSKGPHVTVLHFILILLGFGHGIKLDEGYGETTVLRVKDLQRWLGMVGEDRDGNFGQATRFALRGRVTGFSFKLMCLAVRGTTRFVQPDGGTLVWSAPRKKAA